MYCMLALSVRYTINIYMLSDDFVCLDCQWYLTLTLQASMLTYSEYYYDNRGGYATITCMCYYIICTLCYVHPHVLYNMIRTHELHCTHLKAADIKCPVCHDIQVDPCTLQCGHALCQLCLAGMWKRNNKSCPVCKETWQGFPAISYNYR